jgi:hypothetical protein
LKLCRITEKATVVLKKDSLYRHSGTFVTARRRRAVQIAVSETHISFSPDKGRSFSFLIETIKFTVRHRPHGVEMIREIGASILVFCADATDCDSLLHELGPRPELDLHKVQHFWVEGKMSNYEYLLWLNQLRNSTFNVLEHYPLVPWILTDYSSESIDLNDDSIFRDLTSALSPTAFDLTRSDIICYLQRLEPFSRMGDFELKFSLDDFTSPPRELIPEYFAAPEVITAPNFALPMWADSPFDFVYIHRRLLEHPAVSTRLHHWIDLSPLAVGKHPPRRAGQFDPPFDRVLQFATGIADSACVDVRDHDGRLAIVFLTRTCTDWRLLVDWRAISSDESLSEFEVARRPLQSLAPATFVLSGRAGLFFVVSGASLSIIGSGHFGDTRPIDRIDCAAVDGPWIAVGGGCWVVVLRELAQRHALHAAWTVSACALSQRFDAVVAGTADGALLMWSCERGELLRAVELGRCVPLRIMISPAWGFVISACEEIVRGRKRHVVFVHNINGVAVKSAEVEGAIDFWYCWASREGMDYLLYVTEFGKCKLAEVYNIDRPKYVLSVEGRVLGAYYENDISAIAIATSVGQILFVPLKLE